MPYSTDTLVHGYLITLLACSIKEPQMQCVTLRNMGNKCGTSKDEQKVNNLKEDEQK